MSLTLAETPTEARVVINERAGSIVIGADVEIGAVVVSHKNVVVEAGDQLPAQRFLVNQFFKNDVLVCLLPDLRFGIFWELPPMLTRVRKQILHLANQVASREHCSIYLYEWTVHLLLRRCRVGSAR